MAGIIVLDASALIAIQVGADAHHAWAVDFWHSTLEYDLAISAVTYAEVLVQPARRDAIEDYLSKTRGLNLSVLALTSEDAAQLAQVRAETKLLMPDAIVLQAAEKIGAALATADSKLAAKAKDRGITVFSPRAN
jgi:predicted nucleic acid-binding protein